MQLWGERDRSAAVCPGREGVELGCSNDSFTPLGLQLWSSLELDLQAGQTVSIFVDGYSGTGECNLDTTQL